MLALSALRRAIRLRPTYSQTIRIEHTKLSATTTPSAPVLKRRTESASRFAAAMSRVAPSTRAIHRLFQLLRQRSVLLQETLCLGDQIQLARAHLGDAVGPAQVAPNSSRRAWSRGWSFGSKPPGQLLELAQRLLEPEDHDLRPCRIVGQCGALQSFCERRDQQLRFLHGAEPRKRLGRARDRRQHAQRRRGRGRRRSCAIARPRPA